MNNNCLCGEEKKLVKNCKNIYTKTCGKNECIVKLRKNTFKEIYGVEHALQSSKIKSKMKKNLIEKYGVDNVSKLNNIKQKKIETCNKNFGTDYPMQSDKVMNKSKTTLLKLYGVDNISKLEETIIKIQNSYNSIDEESGKNKKDIAMEKRALYYKEKYNVEYFFQTEEFKNKYRKIMLEKYNVDNIGKSDYFKNLMIEKGIFKIEETVELFENYRKKVRNLTEKTFRDNYDYLCDAYLRGNDYHLDHIYSIYDGFKENIEPEIISSIINLQIIPKEINLRKNIKSWITTEELLKRYSKL